MKLQTIRKHFEREFETLMKKYAYLFLKQNKLILAKVEVLDIKGK